MKWCQPQCEVLEGIHTTFAFSCFFDNVMPLTENILLPGQQAAFIFDKTNQFAETATRCFQEIKRFRDSGDKLGSLQFRSRKKCAPLQAADMLVGLIRDDVSRMARGEPRLPVINALVRHHNLYVGYFDKANLSEYVPGIRMGWIDEALVPRCENPRI